MNWVILIGLAAAISTTISFVPQVIKIIRTRGIKDISFLMYVILTVGLLLWLIYGIILKDVPIILANAITFSLAITVLIFKVKHG